MNTLHYFLSSLRPAPPPSPRASTSLLPLPDSDVDDPPARLSSSTPLPSSDNSAAEQPLSHLPPVVVRAPSRKSSRKGKQRERDRDRDVLNGGGDDPVRDGETIRTERERGEGIEREYRGEEPPEGTEGRDERSRTAGQFRDDDENGIRAAGGDADERSTTREDAAVLETQLPTPPPTPTPPPLTTLPPSPSPALSLPLDTPSLSALALSEKSPLLSSPDPNAASPLFPPLRSSLSSLSSSSILFLPLRAVAWPVAVLCRVVGRVLVLLGVVKVSGRPGWNTLFGPQRQQQRVRQEEEVGEKEKVGVRNSAGSGGEGGGEGDAEKGQGAEGIMTLHRPRVDPLSLPLLRNEKSPTGAIATVHLSFTTTTSRPSSSRTPPPSLTSPIPIPRAPAPPPRLTPKVLVLDLDETLIHSTSRPYRGSANKGLRSKVVEVVLEGRVSVYTVYKRPWVDFFLRKVSSWYTVIIFTASLPEYADPVIDWLDPLGGPGGRGLGGGGGGVVGGGGGEPGGGGQGGGQGGQGGVAGDTGGGGMVKGRLFRSHCLSRNGSYMKDLSVVDPDLSRVCLVDNSPASYALNPANGIPIEGWINDPTDECLLDLLPMLDSLRFTNDVRRVLGLRGFGRTGSGGGGAGLGVGGGAAAQGGGAGGGRATMGVAKARVRT